MPAISLRARWARLVESLRSSLWAIPAVCIVAAGVAAHLIVELESADSRFVERFQETFDVGADGARETLSAIASSVMTVAAVAFSMTIIVLQLASSQFSPRVVRNFVQDRVIQSVLGAYLGTFTFVLLVLRTVRSAGETPFVPSIAVATSVALGIGCMMLLIVFVHHVAQSVQVSRILERLVSETTAALDEMYQREIGADASEPAHEPGETGAGAELRSPTHGFLEYVDDDILGSVERCETVRLRVRVGQFTLPGDVLAEIRPANALDARARKRLLRAFSFYPERTVRQDAAYGIHTIVDIGLRALSPSLNDPTTAAHAVDAIGVLLAKIADERPPSPWRAMGTRTLMLAPRPAFNELVESSLAPLAQWGRDHAQVVEAVIRVLERLVARAPQRRAEAAVLELVATITTACERAPWVPSVRRALSERARAIRGA